MMQMPRETRETARVQIRSSGGWLRRLFVVLLLAAGAAAVVHFYVVPLDVVVVWREPARLSIATDPSGANLRLDGAPLGSTSPTAVTVPRDRLDHFVDASKPGYRPAHQLVRYYRSVGVAIVVRLEKDPSAAPPAAPPPAGAAPGSPIKTPASRAP